MFKRHYLVSDAKNVDMLCKNTMDTCAAKRVSA